MNQTNSQPQVSPRAPERIGRDLKANFAELWESVRDRAVRVFDKVRGDDLRSVKSFDDLKGLIKAAYEYDDARVDAEIDRFVNEGGATSSTPR